jgi:hypothetical protein
MTLSALAGRCRELQRELAMAGKQVLYDRAGRIGEAISDATRKVTMYRPVAAKDWPTTKGAMAKRRFNPATDVKITYTRQAGDKLVLKQPRRSKVRRVEEMQGLAKPSMAASRAIKLLEDKLTKHADKRKVHLTTVADPYGSGRVEVDGLARHYERAGFKDRTAAAKKRERMRLKQEGHSGKHVDDSLDLQYDRVKVMHRAPRRGDAKGL